MQKTQTPNTRPIAKHVKRQRSDLSKFSDQLKIHRNVYIDYLQNKLNFSQKTITRLMHVYDNIIEADQMEILWKLPIILFHKAFLQKLQS